MTPSSSTSPPESRRARILTAAAIVVAAAVLLRAEGRIWWCACGSWIPWSWIVFSRHNSQHLVDPYSFSHILHGLLFYAGLAALRVPHRIRFPIALALEAGWEVLENSDLVIQRYREATISLDYYGDSVANSLSDIAFCALGYWAAMRVPVRVSVALYALIEIVMLVAIRDNLTLNVLMLVWPLESVKAWQMALAGG